MVSVYVSYAWKEEAQKPLVEKLAEACAARGMKPRYDRKEMKYGDSIRQFMDEIGAAGHIVLVLSEAYFTSEYCMYELCQIYDQFAKHDQAGFRARVNPVVLSGTPLYNADDRLRYLHHWERRSSELNVKLKRLNSLRHTRHLQDSLRGCEKIPSLPSGNVGRRV
ncbi:toll/interleukin-1 receptor domain-containing protein [Accumulibacter sp.]|uniref:toll/interleukin-1 receptor domain-containing protein n=1 Tax=Accumulibacter sp. TaxID=2053492 RepID=UPI0026208537|nr:toll/interleukin-1 receptor domain-containing protein [Accumulibacter sp.]